MKMLLEFIKYILLLDLVLSFISIDFNIMMIKELEKQNKSIKKRNEKIKSFFCKIFRN